MARGLRVMLIVVAGLAATAPSAGAATLSGTVTDSKGQPQQRVLVAAHRGQGFGLQALPGVYTGADGGWRLEDVPAGAYRVGFRTFGRGPGLAGEWFDEAALSDDARVVDVAAGDRLRGIDAQLEPRVPVTGRVVDDTGAPVVGAVVSAIQVDYKVGSGGSIATDAGGRFELFVPARTRLELEVDGERTEDIVRFVAPGQLGDVVTPRAVGFDGEVTDADTGRRVAAAVEAFDDAGRSRGTGGDGNGEFRIRSLPVGGYRLRLSAPGRPTSWVGGPTFEQATRFAPAVGAIQEVQAAVDRAKGRFAGTITMADGGRPPNEVTLRITDTEGRWVQDRNVGIDAAGAYRMDDTLAPGRYLVRYGGLSVVPQYYGGAEVASDAVAIEVTDGATRMGVDATLVRRAALRGRVVSQTAAPQERVGVDVIDPADGTRLLTVWTDATGRFDTGAGLLSGSYVLALQDTRGDRPYQFVDRAPSIEGAQRLTTRAGTFADVGDLVLHDELGGTGSGADGENVPDSAPTPAEVPAPASDGPGLPVGTPLRTPFPSAPPRLAPTGSALVAISAPRSVRVSRGRVTVRIRCGGCSAAVQLTARSGPVLARGRLRAGARDARLTANRRLRIARRSIAGRLVVRRGTDVRRLPILIRPAATRRPAGRAGGR